MRNLPAIVQPAAQLAGLLNAATSRVVGVLQAYVQEKGDAAWQCASAH